MSLRNRRLISSKRVMTAVGVLTSLQSIVTANGALASGSASATLYISASVVGNCLISNTTMNFGTFTVLAGTPGSPTYQSQSATATIPYACTDGSPASIWAAANSVTMTGAATAENTVVASLFEDVAQQTVYPVAAANGVSVTGSGASASSMIYGAINTAASTKADSYTGTTLLTINY